VYHELQQRLAQRSALLDMRLHVSNQLHALAAGSNIIPAVQRNTIPSLKLFMSDSELLVNL